METTQKPEICPYLSVDDRGYCFCSRGTEIVFSQIIRTKLEEFSNIPRKTVERIDEELLERCNFHGFKNFAFCTCKSLNEDEGEKRHLELSVCDYVFLLAH
jgi:hypothetical protein